MKRNKKILILGVTGLLGNTLFRYLSTNKKLNVIGTYRSKKKIKFFKKTNPEKFKFIGNNKNNFIKKIKKIYINEKPDFIVNCIGVVKQKVKSKNTDTTLFTNSTFPHLLSNMVRKNLNTKLIHISTDCVFSGKEGNYTEDDFSDAKDIYGISKFFGEVYGNNIITLRTSIIGHEINGNYGLLNWFLSQKKKVYGFSKVIFSGLPTVEVAEIIEKFIISGKIKNGLYHISASPINKYKLLKLIAKKYNKSIEISKDSKIQKNMSLNSSKFKKKTGYSAPNWEKLVEKMSILK